MTNIPCPLDNPNAPMTYILHYDNMIILVWQLMSWLIMIKWLLMAHGRHIATNVLWSKISLCYCSKKISLCYSIVILIIIHSSVLDSPKLCFNLILMLVGYDKLENVSWAGYNLRANINLGKLWSSVSACGGWSPTWIFSVGFYLEKEKRKNLYIDSICTTILYLDPNLISRSHVIVFPTKNQLTTS